MSKLKPITWEELQKYDINIYNLLIIKNIYARLPNVKFAYKKYRKKIFDDKGMSLSDYIKKQLINNYTNNYNIITKNKFPYNLIPQILHFVVWINPLYEKDEKNTEQNIRKDIAKKLESTNAEFMLYENSPKHKSIQSIRHYQLFILCCKNKNNKKEIENKLSLKPMF